MSFHVFVAVPHLERVLVWLEAALGDGAAQLHGEPQRPPLSLLGRHVAPRTQRGGGLQVGLRSSEHDAKLGFTEPKLSGTNTVSE